MGNYKQQLGRRGEHLALNFLRQHGYKIITRNFSCRFGEIDIIAREGKTTVFVEVKTKNSLQFGSPEEAITPRKIKHLYLTAQFYINRHGRLKENYRFDVVSITLETSPHILLIKNAF